MKTNQQRNQTGNITSGCVLALMAGLIPVSAMGADQGEPITSAELTQNGYMYPTDLVAGADPTQLANYAWRLFIASAQNTTATLQDGGTRGTPSSSTNFIDSGKANSFNNPLVFESLYHRTEAFPYYASASEKPPSQIGQVPTYYTYYADETTGDKVTYTVTGQQYVNLDETNQIGQNFLYYQNSNDPDFPVLFMAKVNAAEANYVYDKDAPSASNSFQFPNNVLEVKSAWRRVQDIKNSNPADYHQAQATYYEAGEDGVPHPVTEKFALIALHVIQKTANYQQFIFSTFEHVNAVTRDGNGTITDPAYKTTYDQLAYDTTQSGYAATATGAYAVNAPNQSGSSNTQTTYALPEAGPISTDYTTVVQPKTITAEVNSVNNSVHDLITGLDSNSVWANYRLKGVQAILTNDQTASDYYLANIVVESSQPGIQLFTGTLVNGGVPVDGLLTNNRSIDGSYSKSGPYANVSVGVQEGQRVPTPKYTIGGCQGCHGAAQQAGRDFSFLSQAAGGKGKELDAVPAAALDQKQVDAHNARMIKTNNFND